MRKSSVAVGAFFGTIVLLLSSTAWSHATFVGAPTGYPTNTDQVLTLRVPHERDATTYNVDVLVAIPAGWTALSYQTKATWTCSLATVDDRPVVRFTKNAVAERAEDEAFVFTARTASTVGSFGFPTVQTYNTGEIVRWIGAAGADKPTPTLATLPGGTAPQTTPSTTNPDAPPGTPSTTAAATSSAVASSTTSNPTSTLDSATSAATSTTRMPDSDDGGGSGGAVAGVVAALLIATTAGAALAYRRNRLGQRNAT